MSSLPTDVVAEARQAFAFVDRDKNGYLDAASISVVLRAIGIKVRSRRTA